MSQLIVRNVEEKVVRKLKERAGEHGISMEEEHRRILRDTLFPKIKNRRSFKEFLCSMPDAGSDWILGRQKDFGRDIKF
jgi:plasmid stability protein